MICKVIIRLIFVLWGRCAYQWRRRAGYSTTLRFVIFPVPLSFSESYETADRPFLLLFVHSLDFLTSRFGNVCFSDYVFVIFRTHISASGRVWFFFFFNTYRCELIHPTLGKGNAPGECCQLLEPRVVVNDVFGRCWTASDDVLTVAGWVLLV